MAILNFPPNPAVGDTYSQGTRVYKWDGLSWSGTSVGYAGSQGYTGSAGEQGLTGYTGSKGDTGPQGAQGDAGSPGPMGAAGYTGSIGYTGSAGAGYTGSKGDTGLAFTIAKTYATAGELTGDVNPEGIIPGQYAVVKTVDVTDPENGRLYLWNGSQYIFVTSIAGPMGATGARGDIGYTGSASTIPGPAGDIGYTGSQGIPGELGYTGSQGVGFTGSQGDVGYTGSAGANGYAGSQGAIGYTGSAGSALGVSTVVGTDVGTVADVYTDVTSLRFDAVGFNVVQLSDGSIKIEQGETGGSSAASVSIGISPPATSTPGDMWWNSETGTLKIYYGDADSAQWVDATPTGAVITPQPLYALFAASATTITPGTDSVIQFKTLTEGSSTFFNGTDIVIPETGIYEISFRGMAAYTALNDNAIEWAGRIKISTDNGSTWTSIVYNRIAKNAVGYGGISFGAHLTAKLLTAGTLVRATINVYDSDNNTARTLDLTEDTHNITLFKKG